MALSAGGTQIFVRGLDALAPVAVFTENAGFSGATWGPMIKKRPPSRARSAASTNPSAPFSCSPRSAASFRS